MGGVPTLAPWRRHQWVIVAIDFDIFIRQHIHYCPGIDTITVMRVSQNFLTEANFGYDAELRGNHVMRTCSLLSM